MHVRDSDASGLLVATKSQRRRTKPHKLAIMIRLSQFFFVVLLLISAGYLIISLHFGRFHTGFATKIASSSPFSGVSNPLEHDAATAAEARLKVKLKRNLTTVQSPESPKAKKSPPLTTPQNGTTTTVDPMSIYMSFKGECKLPKINPFDEAILEKLDPSSNPLQNCTVEKGLRTELGSDDIVRVLEMPTDQEVKCYFRALYQYSDQYLAMGEWVLIDPVNGSKVWSEIIETSCYDSKVERITIDLHWTIIPKENPRSEEIPDRAPDVFIFLLDSVSNSQMYRSLPKTLKFLNDSLEAVSFEYVNKVGLNSRPNANAMLLGERSYDLHKSPFGPIVQYERELCNKSINRENYIGFNFKNAGYKRLMAEDWAMGVFNYYQCVGFYDAPPAEHYMRPFQLRMEQETYTDMVKYVFTPKCVEYHHVLMNYTEKFMQMYPHDSKFSMTWMSEIAHDDSNGLYRTDDFFLDFFKRYETYFDNSFVFFMGDHGRRYGPVKDTVYGELEDYNPGMKLIVPKKLRKNQSFMKNLRTNSKKLTTHYDMHATLTEIHQYGAEWNENTTFGPVGKTHWNKRLFGSSFFHPMKEPRNCATLMIPFEYCICDFGKHQVDKPDIALAIASNAVDTMNQRINANEEAAKLCAQLQVNETDMRISEEDVFGKAVFEVHFSVKPSGGMYYGKAEVKTMPDKSYKVLMINDEFPRKDRYEEQAKCVGDKQLKNYCYCTQ
ncbi:unnamed protein product [Bursaphelenchus okinawaensis]|uniref:Sulfatase domain-containing protein n=1 Tax=Bursaphelenchus okinawaensis TaxID=465554 RepID=A0A811L3A8_9BILA|nr:unnamed protein product [Bursaphelenchus okinawaensis]CAG9116666.1 unnamed protein product [Bursaphelenchus okinawaensis]